MGPLLILLSAAAFGAMGIFGKLAYEAGVTPGTLLLLRFLVATTVLAVLLAVVPGLRRAPAQTPPNAPTGRTLILTALGLGLIGYALQANFFFAALQRIDASLTGLLLYTYPLMVTVGAALIGRDRLTLLRVVALLVASVGTVLVLLGAGPVHLDALGVALALGAAITYTVYILVADTTVHHLAPVVLAALVMGGASVTLGVQAVVTGGLDLSFGPAGWLWVICIALISTIVAMLSFFAGLRLTGPAMASILSTVEPVITTGLAAIVLGEVLTPVQWLGGVLVLSCVLLVQRPPAPAPAGHRNADPSDPAEHPHPPVVTGPPDLA